jgi:hypothetical protein
LRFAPASGLGFAPVAGVAVAAALVVVWLLADLRTPDLAAAVYRVGVFHRLGFTVWDERWYAGHDLPGYSLLFAPLASLLGLRLLAALCVLASSALFERLAVTVFGPRARWGAALFALAAVGDIWIGRVAFALGVSFAMGAVLALVSRRRVAAGVLAVLCTAASPVAGALLALAGITHATSRRSPLALLVFCAPAAAVLGSLALLFPEGGTEPYPTLSFAATALVVIAFLWALGSAQRGLCLEGSLGPAQPLLRLGGVIYLAVCLLCLLVPSPMGSNIERYGVLLAGPLLLCAVLSGQGGGRSGQGGATASGSTTASGSARARGRLTPVVALALCGWAVWTVWGPVRETLAVAGNESTSASYYAPVERFLAAHGGGQVRVEVPLTRSHWEAALLAPTVSLARGWDKQLDTRFDRVLLSPGLTAASYLGWLHEEAVSYVALPDTPLDPSSAREGRLVRAGLPYLREVFRSAHWRIYAVLSPTPVASGPGRLTSLGDDSFALSAQAPGRFLVRVHFTRYLTLVQGDGCVGRSPDGWTSVAVRTPGAVIVRARFSVARALGLGSSCRA